MAICCQDSAEEIMARWTVVVRLQHVVVELIGIEVLIRVEDLADADVAVQSTRA
jgi:hypothetical protein